MAADKFEALKAAVNGGQLFQSSRHDLERYARTVCLPQAFSHFSASQWPQVTETIRLALLVRISEETQSEALDVSKRALNVTRVALWLVVAQVVLICLQIVLSTPEWAIDAIRQLSGMAH